ncbi:MAG: hypothetical protein H7X99_11645 [Saprospiraceae bacterium]|nr:hypothetical protein [Saprospiraceae bacterium]
MLIQIIAFLLMYETYVAFNPDQVYCPEDKKPETSASNIVFQSVDGGQTWQDASAGLPKDMYVHNIYASSGEVYLSYANGMYRSSTMSAAPKWEKEIFLNESVSNIFPGKSGPYAHSYESGLFQKLSGTGVWITVYKVLKDKIVRTVLEIQDGIVLVGCDNGIFKSSDEGKTWKQVLDDVMVTSIVMSESVLIGGSSKGLLRSEDGGEHWDLVLTKDGSTRKTCLIDGHFVTISNGVRAWNDDIDDPDGKENRLRISEDGGKTWQRMDENLSPFRYIYQLEAKQSPYRVINDIEQAGEYIFCSLENGIFRSSDHGKTWNLVLPSNSDQVFILAVSAKVIYAVKVFTGC